MSELMRLFQIRSIRFRLTVVFIFFLLLIAALGLFSTRRLADLNAVTSDIHNGLLPNTRIIGDLNDYTSDYRAAELRSLMATNEADFASTQREMRYLDNKIFQAGRSYQQISHSLTESSLFQSFEKAWADYYRIVSEVHDLSSSRSALASLESYKIESVAAFNTVSDTLGKMYRWNEQRARKALEQADTAYLEAVHLIYLAVVVATILVIGALLFVRRSISRPLLRLAECMHQLANNEIELSVQGAGRHDEIGEMARAVIVFRNNALELMKSRQILAEQKIQLEDRLDRERQLMTRQRNFVSMASHEFRTPLTIIDGHARRLSKVRPGATNEDTAMRAEKIRQAALRMRVSIEDLLSSSRLIDVDPKPFFRVAPIEFVALVKSVCSLHRDISPGANIVETFETLPVSMVGDQQLLSQAFGNLLSNAIKYSPRGSPIHVCVGRAGQWITISVQDRGMGIPEKELDQIFECYRRGSNVSGIVGTGIGLYLVRTIAHLHDGEVSVESRENEGSSFVVRLPEGQRTHMGTPPNPELVEKVNSDGRVRPI